MKLIYKFLFLFVFIVANSSKAMTVSDYRSISKQTSSVIDLYVSGVGNGFFWANAAYEVDNYPKLYCQPRQLSLNGSNYKKILDDELARNSNKPDDQIEYLLLLGLKRVFPC